MTLRIAGGGIAGFAAALAAARAGRDVVIHEQAPAFSEAGAGLQLGPNGVKALQALGAWEAVEAACHSPPAIHIRNGETGALLSRLPMAAFAKRFGAPYRVIHRADLLGGLMAAARDNPLISLETSRQVTGYGPSELHFAEGPAESFTALIGADGIRSAVRRQLLGDGPPQSAGQILYRALVPCTQIAAAGPEVTLWLCPGGHVVHYPVSGGRLMNLVAAFDGSWMDEGWNAPGSAGELFAAFSRACVDLRYALGVPKDWRKWAGLTRPRAKIWGEANVTLIGDAAHPMLPYLAQGAVMALEDAATLLSCLKAENESAPAFRRYEAARQGRTASVAAASNSLARIYHADGLIGQGRDLVIRSMPLSLSLSRMAMLYDWSPPG